MQKKLFLNILLQLIAKNIVGVYSLLRKSHIGKQVILKVLWIVLNVIKN